MFKQFVPIHKSGSPSDIQSYRPIAIKPIIAKIFEKLVLSRVLPLLKSSLSVIQHGFVLERLTAKNLVTLQSHIAEIKIGKQVDVQHLDVSKAIDKVYHSLLLRKLKIFSIHGNY